MTWVLIGLGNPDEEYVRTRHNTGRMAIEEFVKARGFSEWKEDKKAHSMVSRGAIERSLAVSVLPNTYMNKSGSAALLYVKSVKGAEKLVVAYDDLDLPFGTIKISFDRGSGGHKGIDSIMRALKTRRFTRVRIGISPTSSGVIKKPDGEKNVEKFILGEFSSSELAKLKEVFARSTLAISAVILEGREAAMGTFNQ